MKKKAIILSGCLIVLTGTVLFAGPPHHRHHRDRGEGVRLATDIVNLVGASLNILTGGPTVVVTPPPPPPAPVVVAPPAPPPPPPPPQYSYGWYNGYWVPCYNGWYYWSSRWNWGADGPAPRVPPAWRPNPGVQAPPPPPVPQYSYGWYNGYWVPSYNGWYYWNSIWHWGAPGPKPHRPPAWRPDPRRPAPPPPPRHHGHNPKPGHRPVAPPPPPRGGHGGGHHRGGRR